MAEAPKLIGLLALVTEHADIRREFGCSAEEAEEIRQRRAAERAAEAASNVIRVDFINKMRPAYILGPDDGMAS